MPRADPVRAARKGSRVSEQECIHGLDAAMCDVCTPQAVPERPRPAARRAAARAPRAQKAQPAARTALRVERVAERLYRVVALDGVAALLAAPIAEDEWRLEVGRTAFDPIRWPEAAEVERGSDLAVLVADAADPSTVRLVAVANEPARRRLAEALEAAGTQTRLMLQPNWFVA